MKCIYNIMASLLSDSISFLLSVESFSQSKYQKSHVRIFVAAIRWPIISCAPCFFHVLICPSTWKKPRFENSFQFRAAKWLVSVKLRKSRWIQQRYRFSSVDFRARIGTKSIYGNKRNWKAEDFLQFEEILHDPLNVIS